MPLHHEVIYAAIAAGARSFYRLASDLGTSQANLTLRGRVQDLADAGRVTVGPDGELAIA